MDVLYIVMPAYNEEENIEAVIEAWYPILRGKDKKSCLIVADSGSTDNTHMILYNMREKYSQLKILTDTGTQHGPKLIALYNYAIQNGADYIFQTDSDGQTDPNEFNEFWKQRKEYEGIFGNRRLRGDGKVRAFVEKIVCVLLKIYFGVDVPDANAPFRLMKADTVKKYLHKLPKEYNLPNIMLTTYFAYYDENIKFCDVSFKSRQKGSNSINIKKIIKIGWKALGDFTILRKNI